MVFVLSLKHYLADSKGIISARAMADTPDGINLLKLLRNSFRNLQKLYGKNLFKSIEFDCKMYYNLLRNCVSRVTLYIIYAKFRTSGKLNLINFSL